MTPILLGRGWWHCPSEIKLYESRVQFSPIDSYHGWMTHVMGRQSHSWRWLDQVNVESTRTCDRLHAAEDSSVGWRLIFYNATWQPSMWGLYNNGFGPKVHWILFCAACCCGRRIANSSGHSFYMMVPLYRWSCLVVAGATTQMCCILWPPCCQFNLYCRGRFIGIGLCYVATPMLLVAYQTVVLLQRTDMFC
jgi:hypothetical protein